MARSVVTDDSGQPILVEFDTNGEEIGELVVPSEYKNQINSLVIMSASNYQSHIDRLNQYKSLHSQDLALTAQIISIGQFNVTKFLAADGKTEIEKPDLDEAIKSVYVRGQSHRISTDSNDLVLLDFPVDLTQPAIILPEDKSILLSREGVIVAKSIYNVAYRVGFFGDPKEAQHPLGHGYQVKAEDTVFGPVSQVKVYIDEMVYRGGVDSSDESGRYSFTGNLPFCPIGGFEFTVDIYAELQYLNFMPIGSPTIPYYLRRQSWEYCYAFLSSGGAYTAMDFNGTSAYQHNFYVDVMFLTGKVTLKNLVGDPVSIAPSTTYTAFEGEEAQITQTRYDFNGDGTPDNVVPGKIKTLTDDSTGETFEAFVAEAQAPYWQAGDEVELQGIYFEGPDYTQSTTPEPDLVRLIDHQKRVEDPIGQLDTISVEDFKNTDILIFRESTGQLVTARKGLNDGEVAGRLSVGLNQDEETVAYRIMLRGPKDSYLNIGGGGRTSDYSQWASNQLMTEPFRAREADHLKPGEFVRVVAINRATGYMGTKRVQLASVNAETDAEQDESRGLAVIVPDLALRPPNLKIWAERDTTLTGGITQGEDRTYLIGSEGAALASDTIIRIYTEWLDHDGSALPDELGLDDGEQVRSLGIE